VTVLFSTILAFAFVGAPQLPADAPPTERGATEKCVWESVQNLLSNGAVAGDIDARLSIGREAAESCSAELLAWAETSLAVSENGESVDDVEMRMRIHYVARGALFAEGKAEPYYWKKDEVGKADAEDQSRKSRLKMLPSPRKPDNAKN
jgi:hypothetical protein